MEEYMRKVTLTCIPLAIAKMAKPLPDIHLLLDSADELQNMSEPTFLKLRNCGESCSIDSVLTALFSHFRFQPGKEFKDTHRQDVYNWIQNISYKDDITRLTPLFIHFPHEENFHKLGQAKDAIEFLMYFLRIFHKDILGTKIFKTLDNKGLVTCARIDKESSPVQFISAMELSGRDNLWLHELIDNEIIVDDTRRTREELIQSDLVIFACGRGDSNNGFVNTPVIATVSLTIPNGDRFFLGSIVVLKNGHYTSYVRDKKSWFLCDDMAERKYVGTYDDMMLIDGANPSTHGILYMYFPDYSSVDEHMLYHWTNSRELVLGVFEDRVTNKLACLANSFDSVHVKENLQLLQTLAKDSPGMTKLFIHDVKSFLRQT